VGMQTIKGKGCSGWRVIMEPVGGEARCERNMSFS